jgi:hypothetical protein
MCDVTTYVTPTMSSLTNKVFMLVDVRALEKNIPARKEREIDKYNSVLAHTCLGYFIIYYMSSLVPIPNSFPA